MERGDAAIGEHGLIGDSRTAALVSRGGTIDWLCLPRFDSPSLFAGLLDLARGGHFRIAPVARYTSSQRYVRDSNVLETTFRLADGELVVRDALTLPAEGALQPDHELLRQVECTDGAVEVGIDYEPRPDYALRQPLLEDAGPLGLRLTARGLLVSLRSEWPLRLEGNGASARARFSLKRGERVHVSLCADVESPAVLPPLGLHADARLRRTVDWWQGWAAQCTYVGRYREAVVRSALVLKLLSYAPSGAIVAAPTTSLPEDVGGSRNYDYRFCWLRDAAFVMRALDSIGYRPMADAFLAWMLHATRLTHPELQVVYDVFGRTNLPESELDHLSGYRGSRPVRVGNAACHQFQLDVYGEVIDAAERFARGGGRIDREQAAMLEGFAETVCRRWQEPDDGIWETRTRRQHYVHSKVLCWVALDRILALHERGLLRTHAERYRRVRGEIRAAIEQDGFDARSGTYVRAFGSTDVDASLLTLPLLGYAAGDDPRMRRTFERITAELADGPLYRRYKGGTNDGMDGDEATFGICSFWAVEWRALAGDLDGGREAFEALLSCSNELGLYAEEIEPGSGQMLGNFPQALTHIGLINAALTLAAAEERR